MEAINNYIVATQQIDPSDHINNDELYNKLINKFYNNKDNSIYIINFIIYDKLKYYPFNSYNPDIIKLAKERMGQTEFRSNIITRDKVCIISGDDAEICEACHIIPYNECKNYNTNNGILLTASLHKMFDEYNFTVGDTL